MQRNLLSLSVRAQFLAQSPDLQSLLAPWQHQQHRDPLTRLPSRVTLLPPPQRPQILERKETLARLMAH